MSLPVPAQRFRLLLPPTQPAVPTSQLRIGSNQRKARPRGEDPSTQIQSPCSSVGPGGGDKLRGAEKGAPASKLLQRDKQEVQLQQSAAELPGQLCRQQPAPHTALALGVRLASAGRREKQNNNRNKPNPRGMQCDNPKLEGPPGWRSWVSNAVNSFRVIPPSTLPCNSEPSVEV